MSARAEYLDRLADQLLVEGRGLDGIADTIEPLIARVIGAWEGPAADRLVSELGQRHCELSALATSLRHLAERQAEEVRRIRAAETAAWTGPGLAPPAGTNEILRGVPSR
jgi:uncharacterized protein YukE